MSETARNTKIVGCRPRPLGENSFSCLSAQTALFVIAHAVGHTLYPLPSTGSPLAAVACVWQAGSRATTLLSGLVRTSCVKRASEPDEISKFVRLQKDYK